MTGGVGAPAQCEECPPAAICGLNTTTETMLTRRGYWRAALTAGTFYECEVRRNGSILTAREAVLQLVRSEEEEQEEDAAVLAS
eukprot:7388727-Prymnesium_polylepis.1